MQLHPLNMTKADNTTISQPPSPNPLLDTNLFGAVPLSALVQTPTASLKKKQTAGAFADEGHFAAALEESAVHTPQGRGRGEDEDVQSAPQAFIFQRQAAVPAASFQDLIKQQVRVTSHLHMHSMFADAMCCTSLLMRQIMKHGYCGTFALQHSTVPNTLESLWAE